MQGFHDVKGIWWAIYLKKVKWYLSFLNNTQISNDTKVNNTKIQLLCSLYNSSETLRRQPINSNIQLEFIGNS